MNPGQVLAVLICLGTFLLLALAFEVALFLIACGVCRVPRPGVLRSVGLVLIMLVVPAAVDAAVYAVLYEVYTASDYPLWEAGIVGFFLALPVNLAICAGIHAKVVRIRVTEGVAVWLVEKLIKFTIIGALIAAVVLLLLLAPAK